MGNPRLVIRRFLGFFLPDYIVEYFENYLCVFVLGV